MSLTSEDLNAIEDKFKSSLSEHIPRKLHIKHHDYLERKISREIKKEEAITRIKTQLAIIGITGIAGTVASAIAYAVAHGFGKI